MGVGAIMPEVVAAADRLRSLGVIEFGQSSTVEEAYELHGIDVDSIVRAAVGLSR